MVGGKRCVHLENWWDPVIYTHCRIDHSRLTHTFLLIGEEPSLKSPLSLKHILMECDGLNSVRTLYFSVDSYEKYLVLDLFLSKIKKTCIYIYRVAGISSSTGTTWNVLLGLPV